MANHPIQPREDDANGVWRFKRNSIVRWLVDQRQGCLNEIAGMSFSAEDRMQFAQLIGYSLSGYGELNYVDDDSFNAAAQMFESGEDERDARIKSLTDELEYIREALREPIARLYGKHPDDLKREEW